MQGLSRLRLAKPPFSISGPLARICGERGELPPPAPRRMVQSVIAAAKS
jgi:hypothetical protein